MIAKLLHSCVALWILGILGMWATRALLTLGPYALPFRLSAGLWVVGGLGYLGLVIHCLTKEQAERGALSPEENSPLGEPTH
jgi:hypothetical protein